MRIWVLGLALTVTACGSVEYEETVGVSARAPNALYGVARQRTETSVSIEVFYEELAAYGQWIHVPQAGRAFVPHDPEYRPYRNGHWSQSGTGLVWVSYDAIGWAVCHYGSWAVLDDGRWAWIPDTQWGPGWVEWRESDQHVGWAPRMAYIAPSIPVQTTWVFVETAYLLTDFVSQAFVDPGYAPTVYAESPPMARRPDRRWLRARGVRRASAGSVTTRGAGRARRGTAEARGVVERGGRPTARPGSVVVRGPAGASGGLSERAAPPAPQGRPRPRETVVLGSGRARRSPAPVAPSVSTVVTPAPRAAPPMVLRSPAPARPVHPAARAPRIIAPAPAPRITPQRVVRPVPRPAPRPMIVQRPAPQPVVRRPTPRPVVRRPAPVVRRPAPVVRRPTPRPVQRPTPRPIQRPTPRPVQRAAPTPRPAAQPRQRERRQPARPAARRVAPTRAMGAPRAIGVRRR